MDEHLFAFIFGLGGTFGGYVAGVLGLGSAAKCTTASGQEVSACSDIAETTSQCVCENVLGIPLNDAGIEFIKWGTLLVLAVLGLIVGMAIDAKTAHNSSGS